MKKLLFLLLVMSNYTYAQPNINQPVDKHGCADVNSGYIFFNLENNSSEILNGLNPSFYTVKFYENLVNSQTNSNAIQYPISYMYLALPQKTIYVRVYENSNPSNYSLTSFNLINDSLNLIQPPNKYVYQNYPNGYASFDLTSNESILLNGVDPFNVTITYYPSLSDFQLNTNAITNPTSYTNVSNPQTIYVKVTNLLSYCSVSKTNFNLVVPNLNSVVYIPDTNFKAKLLSSSLNNSVAVAYDSYYHEPSCSCLSNDTPPIGETSLKIDSNNDGEIQFSEAQLVRGLSISFSNITNLSGIEAFTNLQRLSCSNNQITVLNLSQNIYLKELNCDNNPLLNFNVSQFQSVYYLSCRGVSASNLDLSQNPNLRSISCGSPNLNNINISQNQVLKELSCSNSPMLNALNLNQNNNLKSLYLANIPLTTLNVSQNSNLLDLSISNLPISNLNVTQNSLLCYLQIQNTQITSLDLSQNSLLCYLQIQNTQVTSLDLSNNTNLGNISCSSNQSLTYINIKNGSFQYGWPGSTIYSNPNLHFICADDNEVSFAQSSVGSNVVVSSYCSFVPGGNFNTITGNVTFDSNNNGCDNIDPIHANIRVNLNDGTNQGSSFTNSLGNYSFYSQIGNFTLTPSIENPTWFNFSPVSAMIPFANNNNNTITQNFCFSANGIHNDVEVIIIPYGRTSPGFDSNFEIVYKNKGNQTLSGNINFGYDDSVLDYVSSTQTPILQSLGNINWSYSNLLPFESRSFMVTLNVNTPTETPPVNIGDVLDFSAMINPISGDENTPDNNFNLNRTVVNGWDPNDKTCLEGAIVSSAKIGDYLHYNINFENTGNAAAQNIVVKDVIDTTKFDINSLQIMDSSNPMTAKMSGNKVEFVFQNINLGANQHGNVAFKIKTLSSLAIGSSVTNKADIYFDYNFPVATNSATTTFQTLSSGEFTLDNSVKVYPNPAKNNININCNSTINSIELFDIQGRILTTKIVDDSISNFDISTYSNGVYFLKITTEKGSKVEKVIKE